MFIASIGVGRISKVHEVKESNCDYVLRLEQKCAGGYKLEPQEVQRLNGLHRVLIANLAADIDNLLPKISALLQVSGGLRSANQQDEVSPIIVKPDQSRSNSSPLISDDFGRSPLSSTAEIKKFSNAQLQQRLKQLDQQLANSEVQAKIQTSIACSLKTYPTDIKESNLNYVARLERQNSRGYELTSLQFEKLSRIANVLSKDPTVDVENLLPRINKLLNNSNTLSEQNSALDRLSAQSPPLTSERRIQLEVQLRQLKAEYAEVTKSELPLTNSSGTYLYKKNNYIRESSFQNWKYEKMAKLDYEITKLETLLKFPPTIVIAPKPTPITTQPLQPRSSEPDNVVRRKFTDCRNRLRTVEERLEETGNNLSRLIENSPRRVVIRVGANQFSQLNSNTHTVAQTQVARQPPKPCITNFAEKVTLLTPSQRRVHFSDPVVTRTWKI